MDKEIVYAILDYICEKDRALSEQKHIVMTLALREFESRKSAVVEQVRKVAGDVVAEQVDKAIVTGEALERVQKWLDIFEDVVSQEDQAEQGDTD